MLAERWRVHYNTVRPHSSLGYKPPAPAAWLTEAPQGYGKVESKERLPLFSTPDYCDELYRSPVALHKQSAGTKHRAGQKSIKYEEVYLHAYETVQEARTSIGKYLEFYNS